MSVSGSGVPNRCIDFEDLSLINPDQMIRPCPAFSGLGSSDENCRDPKSAGGWKAECNTALALGLGDWSFPVTAAGLKCEFLEVFCAMPTLSAVLQRWNAQPWFAVAKPCWCITLTLVCV